LEKAFPEIAEEIKKDNEKEVTSESGVVPGNSKNN
jgi:hypothetical protein